MSTTTVRPLQYKSGADKSGTEAEAEREKSGTGVRAPSPLPVSPVASGSASLESRPPSALSREAVSQQSIHSQESYVRGTPQRTALPPEAPHPVHSHSTPSHQIRLPPIQYAQPSAAQTPLTRSSLPSPPLYNQLPTPRLQPPYETSSAVDAAPRGLKRPSDVDYERAPAKRQQLPTFEPAPYLQPHHQCPLPPAMHIRNASEDWLRQGPGQPRSYPPSGLEPRVEPPRFDDRTAMRAEPRRDGYERPAPFADRPGPIPYGMSRFDTLVWASRVHANAAEANAAEANDSSFASSRTTSRSYSESATATDTPDDSSPHNAEAREGEDRPRSAK